MRPRYEQHAESWQFDCPRCGATWTTTYEVREVTEPLGGDRRLFLLGGTPVTSPYEGVVCPHCGRARVVGHPPTRGDREPTRPVRPHRVDGRPVVTLHRDRLADGTTRTLLNVGTDRLWLRQGNGALPETVRANLDAPVRVQVAGTSGWFSGAHWRDGQSRLAWELGGAWYELAGHTDRELLVHTANELMAEHPERVDEQAEAKRRRA